MIPYVGAVSSRSDPLHHGPGAAFSADIRGVTGIDWLSLPPGSQVTQAQRQAEQINVAGRATSRADGFCRQVLRATAVQEQLYGPDYYLTVQNGSGLGRAILSYWPVLSITKVEVAPNTFPRQWTTVTSGYYDIERPALGFYNSVAPAAAPIGGQAILIDQGYVSWCNGRNGFVVRVSYVNGWPHTSLTETATPVGSGTQTIAVDDCTGWAITGEFGQVGAAGLVYDLGLQETIQVTEASATSGPGTLTLASPLANTHVAGVMITTLPQSVIDAVILYATAQALQRGATSTTIHAIPGGSGGGADSPDVAIKRANDLLAPFRTTI